MGRINNGTSTKEIYSLQVASLQKVLLKKILLAHVSFPNDLHKICVTNSDMKVSTGDFLICKRFEFLLPLGVSVVGQGVGLMLFLFFILFLCCCWLFFHGWYMVVCCVCFIVPFLLSLFLVPLIRCY